MREPTHNPASEAYNGAPLRELSHGALPRSSSLIPPQDILDLIRALDPANQSPRGLSHLLDRLSQIARSQERPLRVGIFEGAFDPPHRGHEETARAAIGIGNLDLLVVTCYPSAHQWKPNLSPHEARLEMTSSYFKDDPWTVVSSHSRSALEQLLQNHSTTGVIGSDIFNRFLASGIPANFSTDSIIVTERRDSPLRSAPVTFQGRPVLYIGGTQLAFNATSSTEIRAHLSSITNTSIPMMLNEDTARIARTHGLYLNGNPTSHIAVPPPAPQLHPEHLPERFRGCSITARHGLMNGLLSESFLDEVRSETGEIVAFRKTLPSYRSPLKSLSEELFGLEEFNKLRLANARAPQALLTQQPVALWVERAPGETLTTLLIDYERGERSLQEAIAGLQSVGATLRELHDQRSLPFSHSASMLLRKHIDEARALTASAPDWQVQEPSCRKALLDLNEAGESLLRTGARCGLIHGDAHCGNFLWDANQQTVWAIDLQRFGIQLQTNEPAFPSYEFHYFLDALLYFPNFGFRGIRGHSRQLLAAFHEAYGELPPAENTFFAARWMLQRLLGRYQRVVQPQVSN